MLDFTQAEGLLHTENHDQVSGFFKQNQRRSIKGLTAQTFKAYDPGRVVVEHFIAKVFKQTHHATITNFMPELIALRDSEGTLIAAYGLEHAKTRDLFLEQYFAMPVETLFQEKLQIDIPREGITSIGNFAVANPRHISLLIHHIVQHGLRTGMQWGVATTHHNIQKGLIKAGRDIYPLLEAEQAALPLAAQSNWGTYYAQSPQVIAIRGTGTETIKLGE